MSVTGTGVQGVEEKSFEEELGWKEIDQLGAATLQFGNHCLEYKKLCVALITAVPVFLIKLTNNRLDTSVFVAAMLIAVTFLVVDAQAYYYQEALRVRMTNIAETLRQLRGGNVMVNGVGMPVSNRPSKNRRWRSYWNASQLPYYALFAIDGALWIAFAVHWIGA